MTHSLSTKTKVALISGAALVAAVSAYFLISSQEEPAPLSQGITAIVPEDAYKVMVAPAEDQWWGAASSMVQASTSLHGLEISSAPVEPATYGYFEYPGVGSATEASPNRVLAVEAATEDDAELLVRWFDEQPGAEGRNGSLLGKVVTFQASSHLPHEQPETAWVTPQGEDAPKSDRGTMWIDLSLMAAGQRPSGEESPLAGETLPQLLGFTPGSSATLTSLDGNKWSGPWTSGGFQSSQVNFDGADEALQRTSDRTVLQDGEDLPDGQRSPGVEVEAEGPLDFLSKSLFSNHKSGDERTYGSLDLSLIDSSNAASGEVTGLWDQREFGYFFSGSSWLPETNKYIALGLSEDGMELSFH